MEKRSSNIPKLILALSFFLLLFNSSLFSQLAKRSSLGFTVGYTTQKDLSGPDLAPKPGIQYAVYFHSQNRYVARLGLGNSFGSPFNFSAKANDMSGNHLPDVNIPCKITQNRSELNLDAGIEGTFRGLYPVYFYWYTGWGQFFKHNIITYDPIPSGYQVGEYAVYLADDQSYVYSGLGLKWKKGRLHIMADVCFRKIYNYGIYDTDLHSDVVTFNFSFAVLILKAK